MKKPYCPDCNSVGMAHCAYPENCGGVKGYVPRRPVYRARLRKITFVVWWVLCEVLPSGKELELFYVCRVKRGTEKLFATIAAYLDGQRKETQRKEGQRWATNN